MARIELARVAALAVTLGLASGCARMRVAPSDTPTDPTTWIRPSLPDKPAASDGGTTQEHTDAGSAVDPTPIGSMPDSGTPRDPADAGPSAPIDAKPPEETPPVITATLIFNESASSYVPSPAPQEFSIFVVRDLFIHTVWSGLTGEHSEIRKFYMPSGELYYQKLTPFSTDIEAPVPFEKQVDIPHATSVLPTPPDANGKVIVTDYLPIAGTWISDRSLTGTWTVEIYLDEAAAPSVSSDIELVQ